MAIPVRANIDMGLNQLLSMLVEVVGALPGTVTNGRVVYNTGDNKFYVGENGVWRSFLITGTQLDQLAAPTTDVAFNSRKLTGIADPTGNQDAATKNYVDNLVNGLSWKSSVRAASTANIAALSGTGTYDGIALIAGDRILVKNQTAPEANGIYVVAAGAWTRSEDMNSAREVEGAAVVVEEGSTQANTRWTQTADNIVLNTGGLTWVQMDTGAAAYTAGNGLTLTTNDFSVNVDGSSIEINADILRVKALGIVNAMIANGTIDLTTKVTGLLPVANGGTNANTAAGARTSLGATGKYAADITGNGALTQFTVNHALGTTDVQVSVWEATTNAHVLTDIVRVDANNVRVDFATAPANAKVYRVVVVG